MDVHADQEHHPVKADERHDRPSSLIPVADLDAFADEVQCLLAPDRICQIIEEELGGSHG